MTKYLIYMASGNSSRFGSNKLLQPAGPVPLFARGLAALQAAAEALPDCRILVVSRFPEILRYAKAQGLTYVDCPESIHGVSYTIRAGIQAIADLKPEDYLLFSVADQPWLQVSSLLSLLHWADGKTETARLSFADRPGNPVLFSAALAPELLRLKDDEGGGTVAKRHKSVLIPVSDSRELQDLDTPEDFKKFL